LVIIISLRVKELHYKYLSVLHKYRYTAAKGRRKSTPPQFSNWGDSISKLLAQPAPFDVASGLSHLELAKQFTVSKGGRNGFTVHIYDLELGGKQLPGSPYPTPPNLLIGAFILFVYIL